jgi:hypothetical protein
MESLPAELQDLLQSLQTQTRADQERIEAQTAMTQNLVRQLEAKFTSMQE